MAGVAAILAAHRSLFDALQIAGGVFLVYLGVRSLVALWRGRHDPARETVPAACDPPRRPSGRGSW